MRVQSLLGILFTAIFPICGAAQERTEWGQFFDEYDAKGTIVVVDEAYISAMHDREKSISTYVGNGLAIPHGTNEAKQSIHRTGLSFIRYPEGIDWNGDGQLAHFAVGIAGAGDDLVLTGTITLRLTPRG